MAPLGLGMITLHNDGQPDTNGERRRWLHDGSLVWELLRARIHSHNHNPAMAMMAQVQQRWERNQDGERGDARREGDSPQAYSHFIIYSSKLIFYLQARTETARNATGAHEGSQR